MSRAGYLLLDLAFTVVFGGLVFLLACAMLSDFGTSWLSRIAASAVVVLSAAGWSHALTVDDMARKRASDA